VLRAAADLFSRHGYDGVSMSAIAAQAQVSKANIFHHYKSKAALYREVMHQACADSARALDELEHAAGDIHGRVLQYVRRRLASYLDNPQAMRLTLRELTQDSDSSITGPVQEEFASVYARLVSLIRAGQRAGQVRADIHPGVIALMMSSANAFFAQLRPGLRQFADTEYLEDPDAFAVMVTEIIFRGVLVSPVPAGPR
jgi:TetR/AcrR family transcriptional regulator